MKETPQKILAAAFRCISSQGCAAVSLRDIADEAGVALSQLNYYFKNRETLFSEVLRFMSQDYVAYVDANIKKYGTVSEKIAFLIDYNRSLLVENTALYRSFLDFFNLAMWSDSFKDDMNEFLEQVTDVARKNIGEEHTTSLNNLPYSPATLASTILGTSFGIAIQYLMNPNNLDVLAGFDMLKEVVTPRS